MEQAIKRKIFIWILTAAIITSLFPIMATPCEAKTTPQGQTVGTALFYATNSNGEQVLVSQIPVSDMEADMKKGLIDNTVCNYSLLDRYVTTVHQECQGFTVSEFIKYAQDKSTISELKGQNFTFEDQDKIRFWEIDQNGYDDLDTYTWEQLYGTKRYNFPMLYEYWNYTSQDYTDPKGKMSRDEVAGHIFENGEPALFRLSVRAFSQRYIATSEKWGTGDYNMENCWNNSGLLDNERTLRVMKPMTKDELYNAKPTAADSRYWVSNILLNMKNAPSFSSLAAVAAPKAVMTEDKDNYYIRFSCATKGATIYYNHNYISPSYTPTCPYGGAAAVVPKEWFPSGMVAMTAHAVKEGCTDAGVVTLSLTSSGTETVGNSSFTDVASDAWYFDAVSYVMRKGLLDKATASTFGPNAPTTRAMLVTALHRLQGSPKVTADKVFTDVPVTEYYANAVVWAYKNGVVNGTSETTFSPNDCITRQQIATMLLRYAKVTGADTTAGGDTAKFRDAGSISDWAIAGMKWAVGMKLINGMGDGTVAPMGTATRVQVAQLLYNFAH